MAKILIVDDDQAVCFSIRLLLKRAGFETSAIHHPRSVQKEISSFKPDLVLLDMNFTIDTSGKQGLKALNLIRSEFPDLPIILMTGWASVQLAVEGMKRGAKDFIAKPWDNKQLLSSIRTILSLNEKSDEVDKEANNTDFQQVIGIDKGLKNVINTAKRVSKTDASVLILGESGTGKEVMAEAIHYSSNRAEQSFVRVNLGSIPPSLFESELFGHKKGAFTDASTDRVGRFSLADGGTIFLDEIGDLPLESQVKLLRVLQEKTFEILGSSETKKVDVRIISATNKDLEQMVGQGLFREDLYYRINLIQLQLPALRQRPGDIPLLVNHFLKTIANNYDLPEIKADESAVNWLQRQSFPGNVRQLRNLIERSLLMATSKRLGIADFQANYQEISTTKEALPAVGDLSLEEMEIKMIKKALAFHNKNISLTAKSLGITRSALYRRLQKYDIPYDN